MKAKTWAAFVLTEMLAVIYGLFFDGRLGFLLAAVLGIAAVLSVASAVLLRRRLAVSYTAVLHTEVFEKDDTVPFSAAVTNMGWFSAAFVTVEFCTSARFAPLEFEAQRFLLAPRQRREVLCEYRTKRWGTAECGIFRITVTDFLGLVTVQADFVREGADFVCRILPEIPYTPPQNELLTLMCALSPADEDEDVREIPFGLRGSPGYEHRPYEPGDSLKKVNWKLSAKKDAYFVRKDEYYASSKQTFILDSKAPEGLSEEDTVVREERVVEGLLALIALAAEQSMDCTLFYAWDGEWQSVRIADRAEAEALRHTFAGYQFTQKPEMRLPEQRSGGAYLLFSACCDKALADWKDNAAQLVCAQEDVSEDAWMITPRYEFVRPAQAGTEAHGQ